MLWMYDSGIARFKFTVPSKIRTGFWDERYRMEVVMIDLQMIHILENVLQFIKEQKGDIIRSELVKVLI